MNVVEKRLDEVLNHDVVIVTLEGENVMMRVEIICKGYRIGLTGRVMAWRDSDLKAVVETAEEMLISLPAYRRVRVLA